MAYLTLNLADLMEQGSGSPDRFEARLELERRRAWGKWRGYLHAPLWNKAMHPVEVLGLAETQGAATVELKVTLLPDQWGPLPQPLECLLSLDLIRISEAGVPQERWEGEYAFRRPDRPCFRGLAVGNGELGQYPGNRDENHAGFREAEFTLREAWTTGRPDFRDLRIVLPRAFFPEGVSGQDPSAEEASAQGPAAEGALALTFHQESQGLAPVRVLDLAEAEDGGFRAKLAFAYPAYPERNILPRNLEITLEGSRAGGHFSGTYIGKGPGLAAAGTFKGLAAPAYASVEKNFRPPKKFRHPGLLNSAADLERIGRALGPSAVSSSGPESGTREAFQALLRHAARRPSARPAATFIFVHHSQPGICRDLKEDAESAYALALLWACAGDREGAAGAKAAEILDAWAATLRAIETRSPDKGEFLSTGYLWPAFIWAAELLRGGDTPRHPAWTEERAERFARLLQGVVLPVIRRNLYRNNWSCWAICCHMAIALHLDLEEEFRIAVERWRDLLPEYIRPDASTKETQRDLIHTQMGLAPLAAAAEMAWHQGLDLYAERGNLLLRAVEHHAPFARGDVSGWLYPTPPRDVGHVWPFYELIRFHYGSRRGLPTPRCDEVVLSAGYRPERFDRIGFGTLTHSS